MSDITRAGADRLIDALASAGTATRNPASHHDIDGVRPSVAVRPASLDELAAVMAAVSASGSAAAPLGGGTQLSLGNLPERLDIVVDMAGLDRVVAHNPGDLTATVQAGIRLSALQDALGEHGQFLALDPPLPDRATIGGTLATGNSGPLKWQYGSPRDVVIGMKVVQANGVVTKSGGQVVKNVSGFDMARLHVGGLGTLGVIAEVSLKLTPLPARQATVHASFPSMRRAAEAGLAVFRSDVMPLAMTAYNERAAGRMRPATDGGRPALAVRLGGRPLTLDRMISEVRSICARHEPSEIEVLRQEDAGLWRALADFGWDEATTPLVGARCSVRPSAVPGLIDALTGVEGPESTEAAVVSHPSHGIVLTCWFGGEGDPLREPPGDLVGRARGVVHSAGGTMVVERCPPEVKRGLDVWDGVGEPLAIMRRLKEQYDPGRVLNPGRFVGGI